MIQIRKGMFETNSSSTHAIILASENVKIDDLSVDFAIGEFGWEFEKYTTTDQKASYLYTMACYCEGRDVYQDFYKILTKYHIKCTCSRPAEFDKWGLNGYVDHGCDDDAKLFVQRMLTHEKALIRFLFNEGSFVVTGNDNCDDEESEWFDQQQDVSYKHETFYKGN